jgi:hypothetical protein
MKKTQLILYLVIFIFYTFNIDISYLDFPNGWNKDVDKYLIPLFFAIFCYILVHIRAILNEEETYLGAFKRTVIVIIIMIIIIYIG